MKKFLLMFILSICIILSFNGCNKNEILSGENDLGNTPQTSSGENELSNTKQSSSGENELSNTSQISSGENKIYLSTLSRTTKKQTVKFLM